MKPTNPNAQTYGADTDFQTHFTKQMFLFQKKVLKNQLQSMNFQG